MCLNFMTAVLLAITESNQDSLLKYYHSYGPKQVPCKERHGNLCMEVGPDTDLGSIQKLINK